MTETSFDELSIRYAIEDTIKGYISRAYGIDHVNVWLKADMLPVVRARLVSEWPKWSPAQRDIANILKITEAECRMKGDW